MCAILRTGEVFRVFWQSRSRGSSSRKSHMLLSMRPGRIVLTRSSTNSSARARESDSTRNSRGLSGVVETMGGKHLDGISGGAIGREVRKDLGNNGGELVAVPRARRGEGDLRMVGVQVYDEVLVGGVRVHADVGREAPASQGGDVPVEVRR